MAHGFSAIPLTDMFQIDASGRTRGHSLKLPSQHSQTVPARVPYVIPHGARTGFPAGTRRFLSAGSRRVPGGIAHPVRYPYGSRLPKLAGTRTGNVRDGLSRLGPVCIPLYMDQAVWWISDVIPHRAHTGFPAGTRRFLSAGSRRVPGGIAHPVRYPCGSRLILLAGTRMGTVPDGHRRRLSV